MKIIDPIQFIQLGGRIRYLIGVSEGYPLKEENYVLDNLKALKMELSTLGFQVSSNLYDHTVEPLYKQLQEMSSEQSAINDKDAKQLKEATKALENTVLAESKTKIIAVATDRRFSIDTLLKNPQTLLGKTVYERLSEIAKYDFREACRCLAFECPTASASILLRCIEECVRILYKSYFPRKPIKVKPWGTLLNELMNKPRFPKPDGVLLENLNHLRNAFRNPTDHPEKMYPTDEAEDLLYMCIDPISRCMKDSRVIEKIKQTP